MYLNVNLKYLRSDSTGKLQVDKKEGEKERKNKRLKIFIRLSIDVSRSIGAPLFHMLETFSSNRSQLKIVLLD